MTQKEFRHLAFTWNNYQDVDWEDILIKAVTKLNVNYIIFGKEIAPSTGTLHLQGYMQFEKKKYFSTIAKYLPGCHITKVMGSSQDNINYCNKVDSEFYEWGIVRSIARGRAKQQADWDFILSKAESGDLRYIRENHPREYLIYYNILQKINLANLHPEPIVRKCYWLFGKPGIGKSRACQQIWPNAYWKAANKWWDGYSGESCVVLDDLGTDHLSEYLKRWADRYKVSGEIKGGGIGLTYDTFVITSNFHPAVLFANVPEPTREAIQRRFQVVEIVGYSGDQCFAVDPQDQADEVPLDYLLSQDHQEGMTYKDWFKNVTFY